MKLKEILKTYGIFIPYSDLDQAEAEIYKWLKENVELDVEKIIDMLLNSAFETSWNSDTKTTKVLKRFYEVVNRRWLEEVFEEIAEAKPLKEKK